MSKSKFANKKVTITKVIDDVFDSKHPNGINEGYKATGRLVNFEIGWSAYLTKDDGRIFYTSPIREINEETGIFETAHSTYTIEIVEDYESDEKCEEKCEEKAVDYDEPREENGAQNAGAAFGGLNMR